MRYYFEATTRLVLEPNTSTGKSKHFRTDIYLDTSDNLAKPHYVNNDGSMTKDGCKVFTQTLVQGLVGNIHAAHQAGHMDSAEHLRYIISELERGFIQQTKIETGEF